jgi:5-methylcytosine-specific restriction endonuclease McrA
MRDVLVLNRNYYAIQIVSWERAMTLVYIGHADVIDEEYRRYGFEDWTELSQMLSDSPSGFVHTAKLKIAIPEVIALNFYDKLPTSEVRFTRKNIYQHYEFKCCYCGKKFNTKDLNLDHVLPKSRGGKTEWSNIVLSCIPCNTDKANKTPQEAGLTMHYQPTKPHWRSQLALCVNTHVKKRQSWQRFIDTVYWNSEIEE